MKRSTSTLFSVTATAIAIATSGLLPSAAYGQLDVDAVRAAAHGDDSTIRSVRFKDQELWLEVLLGDRAVETVGPELRSFAQTVRAAGSAPSTARHRGLADRYFAMIDETIQSASADALTRATAMLGTARDQYARQVAAGTPPRHALRLGLEALVVAGDASPLPPERDPFAGELDRVAAALAGETVPVGEALLRAGAAARRLAGRGGDRVVDAGGPGQPTGFGDDDVIVGTAGGDDRGPGGRSGTGSDADAGGGTGVATGAGSTGVTAPIAGTTRTRTSVYQQITAFTDEVKGFLAEPIISDDGSWIVFVDTARPHGLYVIRPDGSDLRKIVDIGTSTCEFDISADGRRVAFNVRSRIGVYATDGSGGRDVYRNSSGRIQGMRLSGDGEHVVFAITSGSDRGVYRIGTDGRGRRRVVPPADLAAVLDVQEDNVNSFYSNGPYVDVSHDGTRIVFAAHNTAFGITPAGAGVYAVRADGAGLRRLVGPLQWVHGLGISSNGARVGYLVNAKGEEKYAGACDFDGTDQHLVAEQKPMIYPGQGVRGGPIPMSADGSSMLVSLRTLLCDTQGGGDGERTSLGTPAGPETRYGEALGQRWSSANMRRHVFVMTDRTGHPQLGLLEIDPPSTGLAPRVTNPELWPPELARASSEPLTIAADVAIPPRTLLVGVSCSFYKDGVLVYSATNRHLKDDGASGDGAAGDGRFGVANATFSSSVPAGAYTVRIKAELRDAQNRQHATAVEFGWFELIDMD